MKRYLIPGCTLFTLAVGATLFLWFAQQKAAEAHCQVPCGIYDDAARIAAMREDTTTITKAMDQIRRLAGKHDALAFNQASRWVMTKENHASHVIEVVSEYFLTQKVKPVATGADGYADYLKKLADHHAVMAAAMKTKQTIDPAAAESLKVAIDALAKHYATKATAAGHTHGAPFAKDEPGERSTGTFVP
ncbi:MAG: superoxide dismutase [Ni] [Phycisphaerae bacterium]